MNRKGFCFMLALILLLSGMSTTVSADSSQGRTRINKSIAVVFDNSGSMYVDGNMAWCRATYAMEVFAAMMNDGDTMKIYPMHPVEIDGKQYSRSVPVVISGPKDADKVRKMYTPEALTTPIETIDEAYSGLSRENGEKWLIVLTDGETFYENNADLGSSATVGKLSERFARYVNTANILYLGIGSGAAMPDVSGGRFQYYADKAGDSAEVLTKLTYMCNMIFGRDTMNISGEEIRMDVSMTKLIVFVQGKNVSDILVTGDDGVEIGSRGETHSMEYSELGAGGANGGNAVDTNLQGMIVTYENCRAGNYYLSYTGEASSAIAYYEPDVDLIVNFLDKNGTLVDPTKGKLTAGEYTLQYGLWDRQLDAWTESELLGNTRFTVNYSINGTSYEASTDERRGAQPIKLAAEDELYAVISADYLSGYHLEKSGSALGFPIRIGFRSFEEDDFSVSITGGAEEYPLSELEELGKYTVTATYQGEPLRAGSGANGFVPNVVIPDCNIKTECRPLADESGYEVLLRYNGDSLNTDTGSFVLNCSVTYTDDNNESGNSKTYEVPFTVTSDAYGLNVELEVRQSFYQISKIEEGEPILVHLAKDGVPLTDEELQAVTLDIDTDLPYEAQCLLGQSAYALYLKKGDIATGVHKIHVAGTALDPLGQTIWDEDEIQCELQKYPVWLRTVLISLAVLLFALCIWLFLNAKILPKSIAVTKTVFNVDGEEVTGKANSTFSGGGKKKGTLEVHAPKCPTNPMAKCGFVLELSAYSPRRVKSSSRLATVTAVKALNANNVNSIKVGPVTFVKDSAGKFVRSGAKRNTPVEFQIGNQKTCVVSGAAMDPSGDSATISLLTTLGFK